MKIKAYTLSTCIYCRMLKDFLNEQGIPFEYVDVDLLEGEERSAALDEAYSHCPGCGFPITVIGDVVVAGFDEPRLREVLGL
ncbi:MAG: glutaredoxin family protein [Methanobacteriota archaeon]|nr:MAG: glutaredoxin family protein [Euryarchaeota archaeon]